MNDSSNSGPLQSLFARSASKAVGVRGEELAERFLRRERGHRILARNWRSPRDQRDEIDLVALDGEVLVFVEVKTRQEKALVPAYYSVNERKKRALRRAIGAYLARLRPKPHTFRFDVVEVALTAGEPIIRHFENIPLFSKHYR
jgi:putative endonuclease